LLQSKTIFRVQIVESKENEKRFCSNEMGGGDGKEFQAMAMDDNLEEKLEPNLDQIIDNIQIEPVEHANHVVPTT